MSRHKAFLRLVELEFLSLLPYILQEQGISLGWVMDSGTSFILVSSEVFELLTSLVSAFVAAWSIPFVFVEFVPVCSLYQGLAVHLSNTFANHAQKT